MSGFSFRVNPASTEIAKSCALLNGVARSYRFESYCGTLSLKSVRRGAALYVTRQGRHLVSEDCFLILNHGQEYAMEFRWPDATETLCPFFPSGFLEQIAFSSSTPTETQLDEVETPFPPVSFYERLYPRRGRLGALLDEIANGVMAGAVCAAWLEDKFLDLGEGLIELSGFAKREVDTINGDWGGRWSTQGRCLICHVKNKWRVGLASVDMEGTVGIAHPTFSWCFAGGFHRVDALESLCYAGLSVALGRVVTVAGAVTYVPNTWLGRETGHNRSGGRPQHACDDLSARCANLDTPTHSNLRAIEHGSRRYSDHWRRHGSGTCRGGAALYRRDRRGD